MKPSDEILTFITETEHLAYPKEASDYAGHYPEVEVIAAGSDRLVVKDPHKEIAIKISYDPVPEANVNEAHTYKTAPECLRNDLLPVLSTGKEYQYIVFPYIPNLEIGLDIKNGPQAERIYDHLHEHGYEVHEVETAMYNGTPVAIDYGT
jgi:hypothetical protein